MMLTRIIVSVVMACVMVPFLFFADTVALPVLIALLAGIGVFEMIRCLGMKKNPAVLIPCILTAVCAPFCARYAGGTRFSEIYLVVIAFLSLYIICYFTFSKNGITLEQTGCAAAETVYISLGFSFLILLCDYHTAGLFTMLTVFIISWMTDIFAYFTGKFFGKHKLIPEISPKKTVEGSVGGILFSVIGMSVYALVLSKCTDFMPRYPVFILAGLFGSVVSQAGDLIMSAVKRKMGIKDYGKLFPGHGGVLDRFDSVLAVSVAVYLICNYIGFFETVKICI